MTQRNKANQKQKAADESLLFLLDAYTDRNFIQQIQYNQYYSAYDLILSAGEKWIF